MTDDGKRPPLGNVFGNGRYECFLRFLSHSRTGKSALSIALINVTIMGAEGLAQRVQIDAPEFVIMKADAGA
ncbi:MAG: hypothetical protein PSV13_15145 [Lacunisphaera sp.]|nr:hypothetical protein [Lacunisphaera sp.]